MTMRVRPALAAFLPLVACASLAVACAAPECTACDTTGEGEGEGERPGEGEGEWIGEGEGEGEHGGEGEGEPCAPDPTTPAGVRALRLNGREPEIVGRAVPLFDDTWCPRCFQVLQDVDGDGQLDLVLRTTTGITTVLDVLAQEPATVRSDGILSSSPSEGFGAAGDVDGDGALDLVVFDADVHLLRGGGDGTFAAEVVVLDAADASAVVDLDGDGRDEVVELWPSLVVRRIAADGTETRTTPTGGLGWSLTVGDVDADGRADLVGYDGSVVNVARGQADGSFAAPTTVAIESLTPTTMIGFGDLDEDGRLDAVAVAQEQLTVDSWTQEQLYALRGTGSSFADAEALGIEYADFGGGYLLDLDDDAHVDLVGGGEVRFGAGDGAFGPGVAFPTAFWGTPATIEGAPALVEYARQRICLVAPLDAGVEDGGDGYDGDAGEGGDAGDVDAGDDAGDVDGGGGVDAGDAGDVDGGGVDAGA